MITNTQDFINMLEVLLDSLKNGEVVVDNMTIKEGSDVQMINTKGESLVSRFKEVEFKVYNTTDELLRSF